MAGGKETPRQKMIGMMYLVLTALLALQIKDTVLEKFVLIENGLKDSNVSLQAYNDAIVADIKSDADNQGRKEGDLAIAKAAENLRKYTNGLIQELEQLKVEVGKVSSGSDDLNDAYTRAVLKKYEPQSNLMVNKKKGEELEAKLDAYAGQVNALFGDLGKDPMSEKWSESLAKKAEDIEFYASNKDALKEDYSHFNFYKAPLASVLAQLTFYQNQLYSKESEALNELGDFIGTVNGVAPGDIRDLGGLTPVQGSANNESQANNETSNTNTANDNTTTRPNSNSNTPSAIPDEDKLTRPFAGIDYAQAVVLAESNIVTAGLDFEASAFLTLGNSFLQPNIKVNGQDVDVVNGRGIIEFTARASAGEYDANNLAKKSFEMEITAEDGSGETITRSITHEYSVARPVIEAVAPSVQALYRECANIVTINVPSLGAAYNPSFEMVNATFKKGSGKGEVQISPQGNQATVKVYSSGLYIGDKVFPVRSAPVPEMEVLINGQPYDPEAGVSGTVSELSFLFPLQDEWVESFPNDANFQVSKGVVLIQQGNAIAREIRINSPQTIIDMQAYGSVLRPGTNIIIKVEEIVRLNFEGKRIPTPKFANATIRIN